MNPDRSIPLAILKGAKGLAILTVVKAGVLVAYKLGTGLVIARRSDGTWSAPSAIFSVGLGWGAQVNFRLRKIYTCPSRMYTSRRLRINCLPSPNVFICIIY